jgi:TIR domain
MTAPKIFISYSHSDKDWAEKFAETMIKSGMNVWFDQFNVKAGEPLSDAIEKGLRESDVVVLLISPENINRPNLFFELGASLSMNKTIVPVVPENLDSHSLPLPLQRIKFIVRASPEETAKKLASELAKAA